jgi:hypothetical protein
VLKLSIFFFYYISVTPLLLKRIIHAAVKFDVPFKNYFQQFDQLDVIDINFQDQIQVGM